MSEISKEISYDLDNELLSKIINFFTKYCHHLNKTYLGDDIIISNTDYENHITYCIKAAMENIEFDLDLNSFSIVIEWLAAHTLSLFYKNKKHNIKSLKNYLLKINNIELLGKKQQDEFLAIYYCFEQSNTPITV